MEAGRCRTPIVRCWSNQSCCSRPIVLLAWLGLERCFFCRSTYRTVGLAGKHASDSSDETSDETTCRNMPGLLAAVVGLGRGRLASRGKQVGCQLRGKLPANATAAAMSTSGVARFQKAADHLSSQSTEGAAPVRSAATMWFTAEGAIERASEERLEGTKQVSSNAPSNTHLTCLSPDQNEGQRGRTRHTPSDRSPFAPPAPLVPSVDPSSRGCTGSSLPSGYLAVWLPSGCTMISAPSTFWGAL